MAKENKNSSLPGEAFSPQKSLPEVRYKEVKMAGEALKKTAISKGPLNNVENSMASGHDSVPDIENRSSPSRARSPAKQKMSLPPVVVTENVRVTCAESLPEVRSQARGSARKGRVVPSRYKEAAKSRATPVKSRPSDASCLSINQSKLFSTATSSTPVGSNKVQDVSMRPKAPPKMAALAGTDATVTKVKKTNKTATVKVKPMKALNPAAPKAAQVSGSSDSTDHALLYNQYLQWTYLCRMSEAALQNELPQLSMQARQLSSLLESTEQKSLDLERKIQAVSLYTEMVQLERQLTKALSSLIASADAVEGDMSRLTTALDASRNRLQLSGFTEPPDALQYVADLVSAAERCRRAVAALDDTLSPGAEPLRQTAESLAGLQRDLRDGTDTMTTCADVVEQLGSLVLQEASLAMGSSAAAAQ